MDDRLCHLPGTNSQSRVAAMDKNDVVICLDDDLIAVKGRLLGNHPNLKQFQPERTTVRREACDGDTWETTSDGEFMPNASLLLVSNSVGEVT